MVKKTKVNRCMLCLSFIHTTAQHSNDSFLRKDLHECRRRLDEAYRTSKNWKIKRRIRACLLILYDLEYEEWLL